MQRPLRYFVERKGQNVSGLVLLAELAIELLHMTVRREHHSQIPIN